MLVLAALDRLHRKDFLEYALDVAVPTAWTCFGLRALTALHLCRIFCEAVVTPIPAAPGYLRRHSSKQWPEPACTDAAKDYEIEIYILRRRVSRE